MRGMRYAVACPDHYNHPHYYGIKWVEGCPTFCSWIEGKRYWCPRGHEVVLNDAEAAERDYVQMHGRTPKPITPDWSWL